MYFAEGRPGYKGFFDAVEGEAGIEKFGGELEAERDVWGRVSPWGYDGYDGEAVGGKEDRGDVVGGEEDEGEVEGGKEDRGEVEAGVSGGGGGNLEGDDLGGMKLVAESDVKIWDGDGSGGAGQIGP